MLSICAIGEKTGGLAAFGGEMQNSGLQSAQLTANGRVTGVRATKALAAPQSTDQNIAQRLGLKLAAVFGQTLDFVVPASCPICRDVVQDDGGMCGGCWRGVPWIEEPVCQRLGLPLAYDLGPGAVSAEALANPPEFDRLRAACTYDGVAPQLVHALKFSDQTHLADALGAMMARAGRALLCDPDTVLVPVPLHPLRRLQRRYNQSALLARSIGDVTGVPVVHNAAKRVKRTRQQLRLSRGDRMRNVQGAFTITPAGQAALAGKNVVLVDDVHTTGATLNALAATLGSMSGPARPARIDALVFTTAVVPATAATL